MGSLGAPGNQVIQPMMADSLGLPPDFAPLNHLSQDTGLSIINLIELVVHISRATGMSESFLLTNHSLRWTLAPLYAVVDMAGLPNLPKHATDPTEAAGLMTFTAAEDGTLGLTSILRDPNLVISLFAVIEASCNQIRQATNSSDTALTCQRAASYDPSIIQTLTAAVEIVKEFEFSRVFNPDEDIINGSTFTRAFAARVAGLTFDSPENCSRLNNTNWTYRALENDPSLTRTLAAVVQILRDLCVSATDRPT